MAITGSLNAVRQQFNLSMAFPGVFSWNVTGKNLVSLVISGFVFFAITLIIEYTRYIIKTAWDADKNQEKLNLMKRPDETDVDIDVATESGWATTLASDMSDAERSGILDAGGVKKLSSKNNGNTNKNTANDLLAEEKSITSETPLMASVQTRVPTIEIKDASPTKPTIESPFNPRAKMSRPTELALGGLGPIGETKKKRPGNLNLDKFSKNSLNAFKSPVQRNKPVVTIAKMSKLYTNTNPFDCSGNRDVLVGGLNFSIA